ncbi:MAG: DoxX family protein [Candidatus Marinimicrobia bacterium]|nr:DoxX family protein [Candidatus Neomarinimicrobiota bacterium]
MTIKLITIYFMSIFYIFAGVQHFANTEWFMKIMPPYIPYHTAMVYISGAFEIILGIMLLFEDIRFIAGWGLIILLIAVFPANIYAAQTNGVAMGTSAAVAWGRLPFQAVFIAIAYWHSKV